MDKGFGKTSGNGIKFRRFMAMLLSVAMIVLELPAMAVPALAATKVSTNAGEALETEANAGKVSTNAGEALETEANAGKVSINAGEALETEANADVSQAANDEASFEDETDVVKETDSTEELEYYADSNIQFAYVDSNADAGRKILTLAGDEATVITEVIDSDYKTVAFDSTRDFVFYVVPLMGWTWDSTDVPVTLEGSYKLKGASEAVKLKKDTDYTVEKAGLTLASGGYSKYYDTYDFDLAYKVTIKANTTYAQYLAKYETAFKQGSGYITQIFDSTSADDVPEITVYVCKKDSKSTSGVTKNGKIGFDKPVYSDGLTDPGVSPEQDSYRWTYDAENTSENLTKDLSAFISEKDDKKYVEAALTLKAADGSITELTRNTESAKAVIDDTKNMAYFWDSKKNELTLSKALVNYAYLMSKPVNGSSKLNISFSLSEKEYEAESVNILLSDATYVTAKGYVTGKTVQDIDTKTGINVIKYNKDGVQNVYITLTKASDADSADRAISGLEYSIKGTSGRQTAEKGSWSYVGNQAEGYKVDTKGTDFSGFVIPAEKLTGDIVLYPKTGEKVTLAGGWVPSVTIPYAGVDFSIAGVPKEITTSPEDYPAETSGAITGEDLNFTLIPRNYVKITELSVDMYDKTNKTSTRYTVGDSEHPLIEKDFGEYSLSKITGKIQVNVRTSRISSSSPVLSKVLAEGTEDANIKLYRINDKKEIVTAATTVHTENTPLTFKAVPADGFAVKSVAISTDGGKSFNEISGKNDGTGAFDYSIESVDGNIAIKVEAEKGFTFRKFKNPYASVKVNGIEIEDDKALTGVPVGEGIKVEISGKNAEISDIYYTFNPRTDAKISSKDDMDSALAAGKASKASGKSIELSKSDLEKITAQAANEYVIYVRTDREEDPDAYSGKITAVTAKAGSVNVTKNGLTLYAGGDKLENPAAYDGEVTLETSFSRKDGMPVETSGKSNTIYALTSTGAKAAASFGKADNYNKLTTNSVANKVDGLDTITVNESVADSSWLDMLNYTSIADLTVKPLNSFYDHYAFVYSFANSGSAALVDNAIRSYKASNSKIFNDNVTVKINCYKSDKSDEEGIEITKASLGDKKLLSAIGYESNPSYSESQLTPELKMKKLNEGEASEDATKRVISEVVNAGTINIASDLKFADGSTLALTSEILAIPQTYGYFAIPGIKTDNSTVYGSQASSIALGLADSAYKSAAVEYRVFEALKDGYDHSGLISEEAIEEAVNAGDIKEVTDKAVFVEVNSSNSSSGDAVNGGYITSAVSGNLYTLTAKKIINGEAKNFTAVGSVDTAPVKADPLAVTVEENITSFKVIMDLTDEAGKNLPDATDAKYQFPQVSSSQTAGKELLALAHSDIESGVGTKKTKGYVFDNVKKGQIFKLPDITAFDEASINPKRTLAGWKVNNSSYYKVNSEIIITKDTEVTPVWAYKYSSVAGKQADGNGKVTVYIDEANAPAEATETIAKGKSINLSTCAYVIDLNEAPINESGLMLTYSEELKTLSGATSAVPEDKDDKSLTVSGSKITGADKSSGSALSYTYTEGSYSYKDRADGGDLTLETTNFLVEEEEKWKLEMDPVTVEEGMTSFYDLYFYKDGKKADETAYTREDALDFNNASIKNIISSIKTGGEEYADVIAYDPTVAHHKLAISGLKGGKSATLQLTVVTDQNITYNIEAAITVTAAKRDLYIKSIGAVNVSDEENNIILIPVVSKETALDIVFAYKGNEASSEDAERWAFEKITPTDPNEQMIDVVKSFTKKASTSTAVLTEKADLFGIGLVKVSYTLDNGEVFTKLFDVKTYYPVVFGGSGTTSGDNKAYTVKKGNTILSANSTEKLIYDGKTSHTIEDAAKYTAALNTADDSLVFLGWSAGEAISTAQSASYPAGKAITFNEESTDWPFNELDSVTLNPQFGPIPVESITGYDKEIRITDEAVGASYGEKSTSAKALTDYVVENITAKPGNSGSDVKVNAYDLGIFTIVDASTPDRRDDENNENYWNSSSISISGLNKKGAVKLTMTGDSGKTLRSGAFTLAKVEGKVGVSEIHIISGDLDYAIPVYVNGAYNDSNVSPSVERYMVDGKNLEEGVKIVKGEKRFYKDYALVKNGVVFITVDEKEKLVFIVNDKQLTTVGVSAYDGDNYYIGKDGYVKYDGLFSGEGSADTGKKYFAYGDGTLEVGELREIEGVTYYFNSKCEMAVATSTANAYELDSVDKKYYVNAAGKVAIKELFTVDGKQYLANEEGVKVTYAMTKAAGTEGKFTVNNIEYEIAKDDTAKEIDRFYVKSPSYSFPDSFTVNKASEELANTKASFVKVSQKTGESIEVKDVTPDITFNPYDTLKWTAGSTVKVTATVDGNGYYESDYKTLRTSPIIEASEEYVISEDGKTAVLADKRYYLAGSIKWSDWPESFKTADGDPKVTATVTLVSDKKGELKDQPVVVTLSSNSTGFAENHVYYTATADLSRYYADSTYTNKAANETTSEEYIVKDGVATMADKKIVTKVGSFNWNPASNKDYKEGSVVTASIAVSYRLEKAGKTGSDTIEAKVVYDPSSTDTKKIYKATVNPTGYYKADGTAYDWTKVTGENIYAVSGGGEGLSEGIIIEDLGEEYYYTGTAIKPLVTVTDISSDEVLVPGKDYKVKYQNNTKVGTASLIITGKGNYDRQTVTKNFNIIDPMEGEDLSNYYEVKSVKIEKEANPITYDGTAKAPSKLTITTKEGANLTANWDGSDYDIEELDGGKTVKIVVENNINKGSGTIAVYGSKKDKPVKKNFSIKAADMNALDDRITVEAGAVSYSKKGAKAAVVVNFVNGDGDTVELLEGRDYTVKYGYTNKKNAGEKAGTVTITGKNNFTKKAKTIAGFDIEKLSLSDENVIVDAYEKLAPKSLKVKVFDFEGEEVNNKSYSITKITKGDEDITNSKEKLAIGDDISVTVKGDGVNIEAAELTLDLKIGTKLSSAKFNAKALTKTYEGAPIYLEDSDLENVTATVKINKADAKLVAGENYEVVSYKNNNNKGNMTVYVRGTGEKVSGFGKFTVKVNAKELKEAE